MITTQDAHALMNGGGDVIADDGATIGSIGMIFLDDTTGEPTWVTAVGGPAGLESPVPLAAATAAGVDVTVAFGRQQIADAPPIAADGHLSPSDEQVLRTYYGLGQRGHAGTTDPPGEGVMVRSEEQVRVGTETVESGRVRLRKHVVTEEVTVTVPVTREEFRLEREPVVDLASAPVAPGVEVSAQVVEMTLHAQRPVVTLETVAVEQIRFATEVVTEQVEVVEQVRKEQIDTETTPVGDPRPV